MTDTQKDFNILIQEKVDKFKNSKEIILELSRLNYYVSQLTHKLWQEENGETQDDVKSQNQATKQKNSSLQEEESASRELDDKIDEYVTRHN